MAANMPRQALPCPPPMCGQTHVYKLTYILSPQLLSEGVTITVPALQMRKLGHVRNLLEITQTVRGGAETDQLEGAQSCGVDRTSSSSPASVPSSSSEPP